ncbi:sugar diacid recognition domain-containing protein [Neisseria animalis]|uniref:Carbohydrate diacid regulon transcriptional regulator CdaR n=1 Tax=Neisseria animalis TaxID=492 RepID=A0A5P3MTW8_NEIAN|nr:sugar diacid recognition domain-containing protein [Neisseria animalis]QEY25043.1 carbohydrate diacid regulon transcriptional regulator CdaR [Neisseria animalis]ROW31876.1 carbohydrate diacid regulon transcriptional regulator CdaR [Neisseria animalis]VEE06970.1 Sugar diacid regulator [Neisseria animalis]
MTSVYSFNIGLAQKIVERTMNIIGCNVNIMDATGRIIASGDERRIGEVHDGALLALSQKRTVDIGEGTRNLQGVKPGINLPLHFNGETVGVIGLTGNPDRLQEFGRLVCMTAEMMLEQAQLFEMLAQDARLKEELVLNLIAAAEITPAMRGWANRLGVDLSVPRVVCIIEVDTGHLDVEAVGNELHNLQNLLNYPERDNLVAILSLTQIVILKPALNHFGRWDVRNHMERVHLLVSRMSEQTSLNVRIALGHYFADDDGRANGIALSYQTAKTTLEVGKSRSPDARIYHYEEMILPVLLNQLKDGWQRRELERTLEKLKKSDKNGVLVKTLLAWFEYNMQTAATAQALFIHRNTLEYRLHKIAELTKLDLNRTDDRFLLYMAVHLV